MLVILALGKWRWEDWEFKVFFGYTELEANLGYWRLTNNNLSHSDRCLDFTGYTEECHRMVGMFSASWVRVMWL